MGYNTIFFYYNKDILTQYSTEMIACLNPKKINPAKTHFGRLKRLKNDSSPDETIMVAFVVVRAGPGVVSSGVGGSLPGRHTRMKR